MNKIEPPVTVFMPVYNSGRFVGEAVNSILEQTYQNFEFLIIDDGSADGTIDILHAVSDPRVRLIRHEQNQGLLYTLNEGIALSSNSLIARMDADDISHPWRLEKQVTYLLQHPECAMVDSWVKVMDKEGNFVKEEGMYAKYVYYTLAFECCIYHPAVMYRKECVESAGGYQMEYAEDYDLFCRLARAFKIYTLEEPLLWYRVHDQNINTVTKKQEYEDYSRRVREQNFEYFLGKEMPVPEHFAACYRYDFDPLLEKKSISEIQKCMKLLGTLSSRILTIVNPNRDADAIRFITDFKRRYILKGLKSRLPFSQRRKL